MVSVKTSGMEGSLTTIVIILPGKKVITVKIIFVAEEMDALATTTGATCVMETESTVITAMVIGHIHKTGSFINRCSV